MSIEVRVPTILRSFTGLRARLVTEEGSLHRFVNVYVNDEDVRFLGALDAKLNSGDTVTILPAVAGGACEASQGDSVGGSSEPARQRG